MKPKGHKGVADALTMYQSTNGRGEGEGEGEGGKQ